MSFDIVKARSLARIALAEDNVPGEIALDAHAFPDTEEGYENCAYVQVSFPGANRVLLIHVNLAGNERDDEDSPEPEPIERDDCAHNLDDQE